MSKEKTLERFMQLKGEHACDVEARIDCTAQYPEGELKLEMDSEGKVLSLSFAFFTASDCDLALLSLQSRLSVLSDAEVADVLAAQVTDREEGNGTES